MKTIDNVFAGVIAGALLGLSLSHAMASEKARDPVGELARAFNAVVDTLAETDPTFRERFLERLEAVRK